MKILLALIIASLTFVSQAHAFDYYVLSLSWSPTFCESHPNNEQCATPHGFVVHGLWPQNYDGTWPSDCQDTQLSDAEIAYGEAIYPTRALVAHEWTTHGSCTGMTPEQYFLVVYSAREKVVIPPLPVQVSPAYLSDDDALRTSILQANPTLQPDDLQIINRHSEISEVRICMSKELAFISCRGEE